ncbi:MAG: PadR family transcriptional regulator [Bryobacterales bacterium]|jgi:DNA-binding PadR family transcriptional regulator|nr:PadR family transcriptional regulator [Bryobacterales bacterium]
MRKEGHVDFIELHILHHAADGELYGLWMIEELAHHGYKVGASHLYPKFHRLENEGHLKRTEHVVEGKRRKYYTATAKGKRYLESRKRMVLELVREAFSADELQVLADTKQARRKQ